MTPREAQLSTLAGCVEYLAHEPKCRIAARKLFAVLRLEQMKLNREIDMGGGVEGNAARRSEALSLRVSRSVAKAGVSSWFEPKPLSGYQAPPSRHFERHMAIASIAVIAAIIVPYAWQVIELVREITP